MQDEGFTLALVGVGLTTMDGIRIGPIAPADLFLLPAAVIALVVLVRGRRKLPAWWLIPIFAILVVGFASVIFGTSRELSPLLQFVASTTSVPLILAVHRQTNVGCYSLRPSS